MTIGFFAATYLAFHLYFTWSYFEPIVPEVFPSKGSVRFESIICSALIFVHVAAANADAYLLSAGTFWVCAGSVIGHGILPPTHQSPEGNLAQRLGQEFWKDRLGGVLIGAIVSAFTWFSFSPEDRESWGALLPLVSALYCVFFVSVFKACAALGMRAKNDRILAIIGTRFRTITIVAAGLIGYLGVSFLLVQSPVANSADITEFSDFVLVLAFFVGAALRL